MSRCPAVEGWPTERGVVECLRPDLHSNPRPAGHAAGHGAHRVEHLIAGRIAGRAAHRPGGPRPASQDVVVCVVETRNNAAAADIDDSRARTGEPTYVGG